MVNRKTASALTIAALLACAIPTQSAASLRAAIIAQATPKFDAPDSVAKGTNVRVSSSSDNMNAISEALGSGFENEYSAKVSVTTKAADAALQDVLNDNADLAAISRPLTAAEEGQGLIAVPVRREKIAIVVGEDNPFSQSITGSQFAQIFRGEIKDWSEVGGEAGPIRVIDRPDTSETRQALRPYPVFQTADFRTGDTATQLSEDSTAALAQAIGADGIGYVLVDQLEGQSGIKAIELHQTPPSDPRYPFSQPYSFVYAGGASPAVAAFLGYATGSQGQAALDTAMPNGAIATPADSATASDTATDAGGTDGTPDESATGTPEGSAVGGAGSLDADGNLVDTDGNLISPEGYLIDADGNFIDANGAVLADGVEPVPGIGVDITGGVNDTVDDIAETTDEAAEGVGNLAAGRGRWWWLLLPLAGLGLLIWAAGKRGAEEETGYSANAGGTNKDAIRSSFRGEDAPNPGSGSGAVDAEGITASVGRAGQAGTAGVNRAVAGGTALAGSAAAASAGLAGRVKNKAGDVTTGLDGVKGGFQEGIGGLKGSTTGGLGNLRSNVQGGIDGARTNVQGGVDGLKGSVQGGVDGLKGSASGMRGSAQGNIDSAQDKFQSSVDSVKGSAGTKGESSGNWLNRAKQRINEATDQVKESASDVKDNIKRDDK